ncbi:heterokaryon incompatibility protein-domain-containing protein [Nemania abortiva]|nr:heterokaryon incompatibility protein-domain-containing protein [Nemania abortiva]
MDCNTSASVALPAGTLDSQTTPSYKKAKPHPYYNYTRLPDGWIRLVRIHGDSLDDRDPVSGKFNLRDDLYVTLHDYPLSSCPDYIALSYTWGDPGGMIDPTYLIFTKEPRCFPINCGRSLLRSTRNLRDALRYLRQGQRARKIKGSFTLDLESIRVEQVYLGSSSLLDLYWIDALCIDQDDLPERSTQVSLMGKIYTKAQLCIVWLGEEDHYIRTAIDLMYDICINDELREAFTEAENSKFPRALHRIINKAPREQIVGLAVFLSHTWFSRLWVLQEAVLAQKIAAQCGSHLLLFDVLTTVGSYMARARAHFNLGSLVGTELWNILGQQRKEDGVYFTDSLAMLAMLGSIKQQKNEGTMPVFEDVMALAAQKRSTNPLDRIYGVLAITAEFQLDSGPSLRPDYELPVPVVYINATSQIASRQNLIFLRLVCQEDEKGIKGLPSWCPDYTNIGTTMVEMGSGHRRTVVSSWGRQPDIKVVDDKLLVVHGFRYDVVDNIAEDVTGLLDLALNMRWDRCGSRLRRSGSTRIDALWRLLVLDEFYEQTPAPKAVGLFFPSMIWTFLVWGATSSKNLCRIITELRSLEPESQLFLPDVELLQKSIDDGIWDDSNLEIQVSYMVEEVSLLEQRAVGANLVAEFQQLLGFASADISSRDLAGQAVRVVRANVMERLRAVATKKCFFTTKDVRSFGMGVSSVKTGDEVWILQGASSPVLLRPLENGNYWYMGIPHVQGIVDDMAEDEPRAREVQVAIIE